MSKKGTPKPQRNWTMPELLLLEKMRYAGYSYADIAHELNRSCLSVRQKAYAEGMPSRSQRNKDIIESEMFVEAIKNATADYKEVIKVIRDYLL